MDAGVVPIEPQPEVLRCGYAEDQLMMHQELSQRQQLHQKQQALQQQALLREQQLEENQKQQLGRQQSQPQQQQDHQQKGFSTCGGEEGVLPAGPLFVEKMSLLMEQLATCGDESSRRMSVATRFDVRQELAVSSVCAPSLSVC